MVGATKSRARAVVFEFARPARDEHRTSRVERGLSITGMHSRMNTNSFSVVADRNINSSSVGHHFLQVKAEAHAISHTQWRRTGRA